MRKIVCENINQRKLTHQVTAWLMCFNVFLDFNVFGIMLKLKKNISLPTFPERIKQDNIFNHLIRKKYKRIFQNL